MCVFYVCESMCVVAYTYVHVYASFYAHPVRGCDRVNVHMCTVDPVLSAYVHTYVDLGLI